MRSQTNLMKIFQRILVLVVLCLGITAVAFASNFSPEQTKQIETIVHNYLVNNPQVLMEVARKLQDQQVADEEKRIKSIEVNIPAFKNQLFDDKLPGRIILGNKNGKVTMVEVMQYQCGHCKVLAPIVDKLIKNNPDLKVIVLFWPFNNDGIYSAKAAIAADKQGKLIAVHNAFLQTQDALTQENADKILKSLNLDMKKLAADMRDQSLDKGLRTNLKLAADMKFIGTPTFIFTNSGLTKFSFIPGQTQDIEDDLNKSLQKVR